MLERLRSLFSRRPEAPPELPEILLRPIGVVRNSVTDTGFRDWSEVVSRIVLRPELEGALLGLESYSHLYVLFWPHHVPEEVRGSKLQLHPMDDPQYPLQGILATRSQIRFNPICLTVVPLLGVKGNTIRVRGLDAVDGSPVLDIKPYISQYDAVTGARVPDWVLEKVKPQPQGG